METMLPLGQGCGPRKTPARGFSLVELLVVMAIIAIASAFAMTNVHQAIRNFRLKSAFTTTVAELRAAQRLAISRRQLMRVTFAVPGSISLDSRDPISFQFAAVRRSNLPPDVQFIAVAGIPTNGTKTPDSIGFGDRAIDFAAGNAIFLWPDGSATDANGTQINGVVYLAIPGQLYSSRAVTLLGATGRIKGWRLFNAAGTPSWATN